MEYRDTAILGAGFGGLGIAAKLQDSGEPSFVIFEKADTVGGTWRENTYPGCACDVPSHLYWYSFDPQPDWSHVYSPQREILANLEAFAERRGLMPHIRFQTTVTGARWDEGSSRWIIQTSAGDVAQAKVLITAWGQLNRPQLPNIEGQDNFAGAAFHSAKWRHDVDLGGKRVGIIGSGASAVQIIPEIALVAQHVTAFQRSPSYVVPRMDRAYTEEERAVFRNDPQTLMSDRSLIYTDMESRYEAMRVASPKADELTAIARTHLESQVSDPLLREKLWPDYPLGCKRVLISDDYYPALTLPNVDVVTERIIRIEPQGIRTTPDCLHELDVLIYATGFETTSFLSVADIIGRAGCSLREQWKHGAEAYYGITIAGFPNLFQLYGPNTNLGHNSIIAMLECQYDYVLQAMAAMKSRGRPTLELRRDAMVRFNEDVQRRLQGKAWGAGCQSWYKTTDGRIVNNWCGSVEDYRAETSSIQWEDYENDPYRQT